MTLTCRAAVLHQSGTPLSIERVSLAAPMPTDVVVKVRAAGLCHTDLEVIDGSLRYPLPMILGHEAAGVVEQVGSAVHDVRAGDHVILSWNPHCGHCFHCDRAQPILCESYLARGAEGVHFDGASKAQLAGGGSLAHLMFLGAFSEYLVLPAQQAIVVPKDIPFDRACLIGCGVMTGVGAALNVAAIGYGDTVMVTGCGAVGLAAVQGGPARRRRCCYRGRPRRCKACAGAATRRDASRQRGARGPGPVRQGGDTRAGRRRHPRGGGPSQRLPANRGGGAAGR
ncbi:Zn-dependent alcohol dehydrogenase [Bradyrhizobium sp. JR3.5]